MIEVEGEETPIMMVVMVEENLIFKLLN